MAFLDEVKRSLSSTGKTVAKKTKEITETMQLKSQISTEKATIERLYTSIGKQVLEAAMEEDEKRFFTEFGSIRKSMKKKAELEKELSSLDGCFYCSECGARIDKSSVFCSHCGAKVEKSKRDAAAAYGESLRDQMEGTKEEEEEAQFVSNEIDNAAADIAIDIVNH